MKINFPIPFLISMAGFLFLPCFFAQGQGTTNEVLDRDEYFRRLEQRALSLSKKFADISGTEPVRLITPRKAKVYTPPQTPLSYSPQSYYDALPGPQPEYEKPSVSIEQNNTAPSTQQFVDNQKIEFQPTMEEKRGEYYLRPFIALQVPRNQKYNSLGLGINELDSYAGYSLGLHAGKRIENFTVGLRLGYFYNEMAKRNGIFRIDAENELLAFSGTAGFSASMTDKLSFDFGLGLGFGNRLNVSTLKIDTLPTAPVSSSFEKTVFTYEFSMLLDYAYSENLSAFGGYRLVGASDNGPFDRMVSHLFEVGVGANF
ncbi:MAG: outer membrane protein [Opitutales bacterium]